MWRIDVTVKFLLTFDYEIAFGHMRASEKSVLFDPTEALLKVLASQSVPATFFADTLSLDAYENREAAARSYVDDFCAQLQRARAQGHDVQTHLHPHWIGAQWDVSAAQWRLEFKHYAFGGIVAAQGLGAARAALQRAHARVADIRGSVPIAFRAGGYSTLPHENVYVQALADLGYRYDSSVNPFRKQHGAVHAYDYLAVPQRSSWPITVRTGFGRVAQGGVLTEIPLANLPRTVRNQVGYQWQRVWKQRNPAARQLRRSLDSLIHASGARDEAAQTVDQAIGLSFDMTTVYDVPRMLWHTQRYLDSHAEESTTYVCLIGHPKSLYPPCLAALSAYIQAVRARWPAAQWTTFERL